MSKDAIILFAHGSRDPKWALPFQRIKAVVERERPHVTVEIAFLEIMQPTLLNAIDGLHANGITHITVAPMFLAPGKHAVRDLPRLIEQATQRFSDLTIRLTPTLGEAEDLLEIMGQWVATKLRQASR